MTQPFTSAKSPSSVTLGFLAIFIDLILSALSDRYLIFKSGVWKRVTIAASMIYLFCYTFSPITALAMQQPCSLLSQRYTVFVTPLVIPATFV